MSEHALWLTKGLNYERSLELLRTAIRHWGGRLVANLPDDIAALWASAGEVIAVFTHEGGRCTGLMLAVVAEGGALPGEHRAGYEPFPHLQVLAVVLAHASSKPRTTRQRLEATLREHAETRGLGYVRVDEECEMISFTEAEAREAARAPARPVTPPATVAAPKPALAA